MKRLKFNDIEGLADHMYDIADDQSVVCAVLFFEEASELVKELLRYNGVSIGKIDIQDSDYSGYNKEYFVTLDTDLILDVETAYDVKSNKYLCNGTDVILYDSNASSKIIPAQEDFIESYEIFFGYDNEYPFDECDQCCNDCSNCKRRLHNDNLDDYLGYIEYLTN